VYRYTFQNRIDDTFQRVSVRGGSLITKHCDERADSIMLIIITTTTTTTITMTIIYNAEHTTECTIYTRPTDVGFDCPT